MYYKHSKEHSDTRCNER